MEEMILDVLKMYSDGKTIVSIAKKYSSTDCKVINILKKYNVYKPKGKRRIADHQSTIVRLRNEGKTLDQIANSIGFHKTKISKYIIKYCGKLYDYKYNDYFNNIDSATKAYILGLLYSDGYLCKNRNRFGLGMTDKECIVLLKNELNSNNKIIESIRFLNNKMTKRFYTINISSLQAKQDLIKHGCCENKTNNMKFPSHLNDEMMKFFILGFYDGDGGIHIVPNMNHGAWYIVGLKNFIADLQKFIQLKLDIKTSMKFKSKFKNNNNEIWSLTVYRTKDIIKILDWLYKDAPFYLKRKHDKYLLLKNSINI